MASNISKHGVVNYKKGKCIDSRGKDWNWLDWNGDDARTPIDCNDHENQKFMIEKVDDWYKVGINQNGYKCLNGNKWRFSPAGNAPLMDNNCNNYNEMKWDYDLNSKKLKNRQTQQCLTYNEGENKFQMSNCSDENDETQAFIGGGKNIYNACRNYNLSHKQCSPDNIDKRNWLNDAGFSNGLEEVNYCMNETIDKQTCINNSCKKPSNITRKGCDSCQSSECNLSRQCARLNIPDNLCVSKSTVDLCEEYSLTGDKCTSDNVDQLANKCSALGLKTAASGYNCNQESIEATLKNCTEYGLPEAQCSIKGLDLAKQTEMTQQAIQLALQNEAGNESIYVNEEEEDVEEVPDNDMENESKKKKADKKKKLLQQQKKQKEQKTKIMMIFIILLVLLLGYAFF